MTLVCLPFPIKTNAVWYCKIDEVNKGNCMLRAFKYSWLPMWVSRMKFVDNLCYV